MKVLKRRGISKSGGLAGHRRVRVLTFMTNLLVGLALLSAFAALAEAQQPAMAPDSVKHVIGFDNIKSNAMGDLTIQGNTLQFKSGKKKAEVSIPSIQDVFTEQDFKQLVGGTTGTLAKMAMPYETGRVVSLFQDRIDVLTVEYRDANGGLHGVIFTLAKDQAPPLKKQLVALGAHASIAPDQTAKPEEKKP